MRTRNGFWGLAAFFASALALAAPPLAGQPPGGDATDAYFRAVAEHFRTTEREVSVLAQWGLSAGEIPVVLYLAERAQVSPDVVVAQRRRGAEWMDIASGLSVHAGDFHVPVDGPAGFLSDAYARFGEAPPSAWSGVRLTDAEVVGLVNVRFLSRSLGRPAAEVARGLGDGADMVAGFSRLTGRGGESTAGVALGP